MKNLHAFFNDDNIAIVTSQSDVFHWMIARNIEAYMLDSIVHLPANVVDLCGSTAHHVKMRSLIETSPQTKLISIPQNSFDGSSAAVLYSFNQLINSDCLDSVAKQGELLPLFENTSSLSFSGKHTSGVCHLSDEIQLSTLDFTDFSPGTTCSVAQLFEVSIDHAHSTSPAPFDISGSFEFSGLLAARSPHYSGNVIPQEAIHSLIDMAAQSAYAKLVIEKNQIVSIRVDGVEIKDLIASKTGPGGLQLTEFAIGLNRRIKKEIDWRINSQLNEGVEGVHFGIGDGTSGLHIDFLCPEVIYNFEFEAVDAE